MPAPPKLTAKHKQDKKMSRRRSKRHDDQSSPTRTTKPVYGTTVFVGAIGICSLILVAMVWQKSAQSHARKNAGANTDMVVAGYLPEYRNYIDLDNASVHLTDLILFSIAPEADGSIRKSTCCLDSSHFIKARAAREHRKKVVAESGGLNSHDLRIFVSVGGGGRSNSFPGIASDERQQRSKFVRELITLCERESLNGVDFDWEQPRTQEEFMSYVQLLLEASVALHEAGLFVSVALHPKQVLPKQVYAQLDRVHLMAYDMINKSAGSDFHHARYADAVRETEALIASGCGAAKILLGIPAYARHQQNPGMVKTYSEIIDDLSKKGALPDDAALRRMRTLDGYAYDAPIDVEKKIGYAHKTGLGGVFFWEIGQDLMNEKLCPGGMLLQSATRALDEIRKSGIHEDL